MRCRTCGYSLWNLAARECPECGASFRPSDFEFVPGTVRFCCPHCRRDYYGTDDRGQLSPRAFSCEQCGAAIDMDGMLLLPAEGLTDADTEPGVMPWLERGRRGLVKSYLGTVGLAMVRPARLMRGVPMSASVGEAMVFGVATSALAFLMDYDDLADELEGQNAYRATLGLPPLPDLLTVTHGHPASGG